MDRDTLEVLTGAEAVVALRGHSVVKKRIPKDYRIAELDTKLRRERTRLEAKIQSDARRAGVPTPIIGAIDSFSITMERIEGPPVSSAMSEAVAEDIGVVLCALHSAGIVHGDPTTHNMILSAGKVYLIDFGLSSYDRSLEARGVDVHVFFQTLQATDDRFPALKDAFLAGYARNCSNAALILEKVNEIKERGRYL
ncbi:MAG: Kae1-associated kinase Bud32 [Halobacteriota archaeon]